MLRRRHRSQSKEGRRRMWLRRPRRHRITGGGALDASAHAVAPAESGNRAVPLLEVSLAREALAREATVVKGAIEELLMKVEVRRSWDRRHGGVGDL